MLENKSQDEVGEQSEAVNAVQKSLSADGAAFDRNDNESQKEQEEGTLEVKASIHVDDEIVLGTASVNQSVDSHPIEGKIGSGIVKVHEYLQDENLPERAHSQLENPLSRGAISVDEAKGDGVYTRNEVRSGGVDAKEVDESTLNRKADVTSSDNLLGQFNRMSETAQTAEIKQKTVPNTARASNHIGDSDKCDDMVAMHTEIDRKVSHGFSSENLMMRSMAEVKGDISQNFDRNRQTETEKTGSQILINPSATGELEYNRQQVEVSEINQEEREEDRERSEARGDSEVEAPSLGQPSFNGEQLQQLSEHHKSQEKAEVISEVQSVNNLHQEASQAEEGQADVKKSTANLESEPPVAADEDSEQLLKQSQEHQQQQQDEPEEDDLYSEDEDQKLAEETAQVEQAALSDEGGAPQLGADPDDRAMQAEHQFEDAPVDQESYNEDGGEFGEPFLEQLEADKEVQDRLEDPEGMEDDHHESHIEIKSSRATGAGAASDREEKRMQVETILRDTTVMDELERLVINLNHTAMANLKTDQFAMAKRLLLKAELNLAQVDSQCAQLQVATDSISDLGDANFAKKAGVGPLDALKNRLMGLTYNNLGCLCKQQQDFIGALQYLKKALNYESRLEEYEEEERDLDELMDTDVKDLEFQFDLRTIQCNSAGTILNICAILSKLSKHKQAQEYAFQAIEKLRHSMRLTKQQVVQTHRKIALTHEQLEQERQMAQDGQEDGEAHEVVAALQKQLGRQQAAKDELENQWVNLATTAVIAHYNAAVELEFTSNWREALEQYEKALQLASLAMKEQNPMSAKIKQAIGKMRMKVRNKVQLPDKLALKATNTTASKGKKGTTGQKSSFAGNTSRVAATSNAPAMKDWQTSVNSTKSSQFNQQFSSRKHGGAPTVPTMSNEYTIKDSEQLSPRRAVNFHPNASLESTENQICQQLSSIDNSIVRDSFEASTQVVVHKKVGLKTVQKTKTNERSPVSLKTIINKLEMTEKQEAKLLQPKSKFRSQRANPMATYRATSPSPMPGEDASMISVLQERQNGLMPGTALQSIRTTSIPGSRISRNAYQRNTINSGGFNQGADPSFLPALTGAGTAGRMNATGGFNQGKSHQGRGSTVQGVRDITTPINQTEEGRGISTSFPKTMRSVQQKGLPGVNTTAWGWGTLPKTIDESNNNTQPINIDVQETTVSSMNPVKHHRRAGTLDASQMGSTVKTLDTTKSLNLSPTRIQMQLSIAQERRLIEQGKRLGANKTKREQDINFFLGHIKRQTQAVGKGNKGGKSHRLASPAIKVAERQHMPMDLSSVRAQVILETSAAQLAGSAYLPSKLKKTLKQRQYVTQIKTMQKQLVKEQQLDLGSKLETAFQREMAMWKSEREQQLSKKLQELEAEQERRQEAMHMTQQTASNFDDDERLMLLDGTNAIVGLDNPGDGERKDVNETADELINARAGEASAIGSASVTDQKPGLPHESAGDDEQHAGDALSAEQAQEARSIQQESIANQLGIDAGPSVDQDEEEVGNFRVSPHPPQAKSKTMGFGVEHGQVSIHDETPLDAPKDAQDDNENGTGGEGLSSHVPVSEYVSSQQNATNENNMAVDALSGTQCQEVELDQSPHKQTENLEVEDVVSADTNNAAHNFQSYRTSSNVFRTDVVGVVDQDELYKKRKNADSALQKLQTSRTGNRSQHGAKSQLEVISLDQIGDPNAILGAQHDSMAAVSPINYKAHPDEYSQEQPEHEQVDNVMKSYNQIDNVKKPMASQIGASSIEESQMTETVMTLKSEYADGMNIQDSSTLHEDTIAGWRVQRTTTSRPHSRLVTATPELTDGQETVIQGTKSQIGDGPIYIKKSTDFHTSNRRIKHIDSQSSLGGTMKRCKARKEMIAASHVVSKENSAYLMMQDQSRQAVSRQISDITCTTQDIKYNDARIHQSKRINLADSRMGTQTATGDGKRLNRGSDSLQQNSIAQASELVCAKRMSGLSMEEASSAHDNVSQATEILQGQITRSGLRIKISQQRQSQPKTPGQTIIKSGQTTVQAKQKSVLPNVTSFDYSDSRVVATATTGNAETYMTPRPVQNLAHIVRKETLERNTNERTSVDTEKVAKQAPKHIQYSKSTNKRPPAHGQAPVKKMNTMQKNEQHMRYVAQLANAPPQPKKSTASANTQVKQLKPAQAPINAAPIPTMIHVQQQSDSIAARSMVVSPQIGTKRHAQTAVAPTPDTHFMAKSGDQSRGQRNFQQQEPIRMQTPIDSAAQQKTEVVMDYTYLSRMDEGEGDHDDEGEVQTEHAAGAGVNGTEDRVAKIAQKISKLNTTLLQFQKENEETKKDPMLKSTHRSTASKHGLMSQKSRETYITVPAEVKQMQEQRAIANLQSAPGRSRLKVTGAAKVDGQEVTPLSASASQHEPKTAQGVQTPQMIRISSVHRDEAGSLGDGASTPRNVVTSPAAQELQ